MNKLKKVGIAISVFINGIVAKVLALSGEPIMPVSPISMYAVDSGKKLARIGKIAIPIILFIIGIFVVINKKITKKLKVIVASLLILLGIAVFCILHSI